MSQKIYQFNFFLLITQEQLMQITIGQSKTRESAQQYLKIEQNTQYLTHLIRYSTNKRRVYLKPDMNHADLRSIAALTVQLSYLLFTCYVKQVTVLISQKCMLLSPLKRELNPQICCEYILQKDFLTLREEEQKIIAQNFVRHEFSKSEMWAYGKYTLNYVKSMLELVKPQLQRLKTAADKNLAKQFLNLQAIKNFLQARLQTIEHPRIVILSFEESQIFREYSILVKVMNNSIFSSIKSSKFKGIFSQICTLEYNLSKSKDKNKTFLEVYSLEVEASIEELMRLLIKFDIIIVEQSLNNTQDKVMPSQASMKMGAQGPNRNMVPPINPNGQMRAPNPQQLQPNQQQPVQPNQNANILNNINKPVEQTTRPYILGDVQDINHPDRKYSCKIQLNEKPWRAFNNKVYETLRFQALNNYNTSVGKMEEQSQVKQQNKDQKPPQMLSKNQFVIQFTPVKGLLVVKYITPIELNIENTDLVMFQCNNIAYHWSQVSMELVEKSANKLIKKKERYLALKTITHLHIADRPLFKLLLMLDLVMLCAKIAEPELKKNVIKAQDYSRIEQISLKVNHMINLFIRKIEKYYKILSQAENSYKKAV